MIADPYRASPSGAWVREWLVAVPSASSHGRASVSSPAIQSAVGSVVTLTVITRLRRGEESSGAPSETKDTSELGSLAHPHAHVVDLTPFSPPGRGF